MASSTELRSLMTLIKNAADEFKRQAGKRSDMRYPLERKVSIRTLGPISHNMDAFGLDISYQGAGLLLTQALDIKSYLVMKIGPEGECLGGSFRAKVVYCRSLTPSIYRVGVMFDLEDD